VNEGMQALVSTLDAEVLQKIESIVEPLITPERIARLDTALATRSREVVMVLEDLLNEHNGAAVLRTAEAFGFFEVHVMEPEPGRFKVNRRISKGTQKWLDLHRHVSTADACAHLKARGYAVWVSALQGDAVDVHDIPIDRPIALLFGNELNGVSAEALARADGCFRIPMSGFVESFNISVAAAISLYDVSLRMRSRGGPRPLDPLDARQVRTAWLARAAKSAADVLERAGLPLPVLHRETFLDEALRHAGSEERAEVA